MSTIPESAQWVPDVNQIAVEDAVLGGPDGVINVQAKQLADRTAFLKLATEATSGVALAAQGKADTAIERIDAAEANVGTTAENAAAALSHKNAAVAAKALTEQARDAAQGSQQQAGQTAAFVSQALAVVQEKAGDAQTNANAAIQAAAASALARDQFIGTSATAAAAITSLAATKVTEISTAAGQALIPMEQARTDTINAAGTVSVQTLAAINAATTASADRTLTQTAKAATELARDVAQAARDSATVNADVYTSTAVALAALVVSGVTMSPAGTGGANGTFALAFTGGGGVGAAGTFTVAGGIVAAVAITNKGAGYTSAPTVSFAASSGLTGAVGVVATASAVAIGSQFQVVSADGLSIQRYKRDSAGSVSTVGAAYPSAASVEAIPVKNVELDYGGLDPLATFAARDAAGVLHNLLSFFPDGTMQSAPISALVSGEVSGNLGGMKFGEIEAAGFGAFVLAQRDSVGDLWAVSGVSEDGSPFPSSGANLSADLVLLPIHGQSNMAADDSKPPLSTAATGWGSVMFARGVATWSASDNPETPASRADSGFVLVDMKAGIVETRANAMADAYKARLIGATRFSQVDTTAGPKVMVTYPGVGGRKLTELGPDDDGASNRGGEREPGGYWPTMLNDIARAKAAAALAGYSFSVPGWIYDQGESEGDLKMLYNGATLLPSEIITQYGAKALAMAVAFDSAVRGITGKTRPIPLFVTPATYNQLTPTAWQNVADVSPLVYIVGPRYQMPSAKNATNGLTGASQNWGNEIHLSPDGQRWVGEMCAKVMHRVLKEGENWQPLRALSAVKVDTTRVDILMHVPRPPMVVDTTFFPKAKGWGFSMYTGSIDAPVGRQYPTAIELLADGRTVRATFASVPSGSLLSVGTYSICELGTYTVSVVGAGAASSDGFAQYTVSVAGDIRPALVGLTNEGAFFLDTTDATASGVIRSVTFDGANTVMTGETRELRTGGTYGAFMAGKTLQFRRMNPFTNLRDSDNAMSLNTFASGPRAGQLYPLNNWLSQYEAMPITGA